MSLASNADSTPAVDDDARQQAAAGAASSAGQDAEPPACRTRRAGTGPRRSSGRTAAQSCRRRSTPRPGPETCRPQRHEGNRAQQRDAGAVEAQSGNLAQDHPDVDGGEHDEHAERHRLIMARLPARPSAGYRSECLMACFALSADSAGRFRKSGSARGAWAAGAARTTTRSRAALRRGLELGCNFLDTAAAYGNGHSEQLIRDVLRDWDGPRPYIATKVPPKNGQWPGRAEYAVGDVFPADHIRAVHRTQPREPRRRRGRPAAVPRLVRRVGERRRLATRGRRPERAGPDSRHRHQRQPLGTGQRASPR